MPILLFASNDESRSMPIYFFWMKYVSWMYYAFEAIMITIWTRSPHIACNIDPVAYNSSIQCLQNGDAVLTQLSIDSVYIYIRIAVYLYTPNSILFFHFYFIKTHFERDISVLMSMFVSLPIIAGLLIYLRFKIFN